MEESLNIERYKKRFDIGDDGDRIQVKNRKRKEKPKRERIVSEAKHACCLDCVFFS